jgi:hypothetical protein
LDSYLSRVDHDRKIGSIDNKTDAGNYSSVNRTIQVWNQLPADAVGTLCCKQTKFRKEARKVIHQLK